MQENKTIIDSEPEDDEMSEREIDQNLDESFPASDPPSWTLGTEHHRSKREKEPDADSIEKTETKID